MVEYGSRKDEESDDKQEEDERPGFGLHGGGNHGAEKIEKKSCSPQEQE